MRLLEAIPKHALAFYTDMRHEWPATGITTIAKQRIDFAWLIAFNWFLPPEKVVLERAEIEVCGHYPPVPARRIVETARLFELRHKVCEATTVNTGHKGRCVPIHMLAFERKGVDHSRDGSSSLIGCQRPQCCRIRAGYF